ncbi:GNAT family N-acetyltransferase [Parasphingopyxis sp. GrpM-11]|uniref:GNAT family N-acetyltransferase n=1 Tax=Parasphingopyxis marina TaxID=2761622 RepID=A0A842HZD4_9SPHN|nr:GNAT family N-acetyltransferase [Parasphingopyxis marina]
MPALTIERADPRSPDAVVLLDRLSNALAAMTGSSGRGSFDITDIDGERAAFLLAYDEEGRAVGCGSYRPFSPDEAEIKRMLALPGTRGVGGALLVTLERMACADGYATALVETRKVNQRAVGFYERHGYRRIPNYGKYRGRPEAVCFSKSLG